MKQSVNVMLWCGFCLILTNLLSLESIELHFWLNGVMFIYCKVFVEYKPYYFVDLILYFQLSRGFGKMREQLTAEVFLYIWQQHL